MDKLECIKLFSKTARLGSFTVTANELNITQGAVSKKIAWLEHNLGFTLFHRTSRKINLTDAGEQYLKYCNELIEKMTITEQRLKNELSTVVGVLKISAPSAFATQRLAVPISKFLSLNPRVSVEISVNDRQVDLYSNDIDIAIRASHLKDSGLKAKKLINHELCYFASPEYLKKHGTPLHSNDISIHSCITYSLSTPSNVWHFNKDKHIVRELISSDSPEMIVKMAVLGCGIAAMPKWMIQKHIDNKELIELFDSTEKHSLPMYAIYKDVDYLPYRIKAFIDFIANYFAIDELK
jgi:DNA-binding transcriptional LysR family regulator